MSSAAALVSEAVKHGHPLFRSLQKKRLELTPDLFGKLFVLAWAERNGRSDLAARDVIVGELLDAAESAPLSVQNVMHVEDRITGPTIAEYTDYMVSAQDDGLLKRYNPAYVRCFVEVDQFEARNLLTSYEGDLKEEIDWLRERVGALPGV